MQRVQAHIAVVVSASESTQSLRHDLIEAGIAPAGLASHLRGLRRGLVLGEYERVTLCIALDSSTLQRHGDLLRQLLQDRRSFPTAITAIGMTAGRPLTAEAASLGCDVYLDHPEQIVEAVCFFERATDVHNNRCTMSVEPESWASTLIEHLTVDEVEEYDRTSDAHDVADDPDDTATTPSPNRSRRSEKPSDSD